MKKLFDMTNPFWSFVGKLFDVIVLHTFWLVCSLPIVTFGPATIALYYTLMKDARDEGSQYYRTFFRAFKENLRQGIPMGLIFLIGVAALIYAAYLDYAQYQATGQFYWDVLKYVCILLLFLWVATFEYAFPLLARFDNTVKKTIQNGFFFSIKNMGWTLVMTAIFVLFYFLVLWFGEYVLVLLILGFGFIVFLDAYILNHIFKPYVEQEEERARAEEEKIDELSAEAAMNETTEMSSETETSEIENSQTESNTEGDEKDE